MILTTNIFGELADAEINAILTVEPGGAWHNHVKFAMLVKSEADFIQSLNLKDGMCEVRVAYQKADQSVRIIRSPETRIEVKGTISHQTDFVFAFGARRVGFNQYCLVTLEPNGLIHLDNRPLGYVEECPFKEEGKHYLVEAWLTGGTNDLPFRLFIDPFTLVESMP